MAPVEDLAAEATLPVAAVDYERFFRATYARLVVALTLTSDRSAAEDAVQDAYLQALRHWGRIKHYDDPAAWVRRAALNRLANQRRGSARRDRAVDRLAAATTEHTRDQDTAALTDLRAALAELPERERAVVVLHHVIGVPVADLATELDLPAGTVKSILSRTRDRLRDLLGDPPIPTTGGGH
jgi:RNA polymerase sigma-70 factor, ECF subfamily